ncbi:hypothetical protein [Campylobacter helveticus]|uniref:hypothetical protein n=1 Tax=Campylobacter helveticus TaxID=28898 RepID=UPI0022EAE1BD|nr:hypothetical protein [Campylobacter helveticus]
MKNKNNPYNEAKLYYQLCDEAKKYFNPQSKTLSKESIQDFFKAMQKQHKALKNYDLLKHKDEENNFLIVSKTKKAYISLILENEKELNFSGYSLETKEQGLKHYEKRIKNEYEMLY